ncbi:hypothetical protein NEAUS04_0669 [Nematocida ausubeli]|nr:hypothetical protein NEAUS04_0669 [Nematocida ausubeli]
MRISATTGMFSIPSMLHGFTNVKNQNIQQNIHGNIPLLPSVLEQEEAARKKKEYSDFIEALQYKNRKVAEIQRNYPSIIWGMKIAGIPVINLYIDNENIRIIIDNFDKIASVKSLHIQIDNPLNTIWNRANPVYQNLKDLIDKIKTSKNQGIIFTGLLLDSELLTSLAQNIFLNSLTFFYCALLNDHNPNDSIFIESLYEFLNNFNHLETLSFMHCNLHDKISTDEVAAYSINMQRNIINARRNLQDIELIIEGESEHIIVGLLLLTHSVKKLSIIENSLYSLNFLNREDIFSAIANMHDLSIMRETKLSYFDIQITRIIPKLRNLTLICINPNIKIATWFFMYELYTVTHLVIDEHLFEQLGHQTTLFIRNKREIAVYSNNKIMPDYLRLKITSEPFNSLDTDLTQNVIRMKIQIFVPESAKDDKNVKIILPRSLSTAILSVEVFSEQIRNNLFLPALIRSIITSYQNIKMLSVFFSSPAKQSEIDVSVLKQMESLTLFTFNNLTNDTIFSYKAESGCFTKGKQCNTLSMNKENNEWKSLIEHPNYILYIVDARYFGAWIKINTIPNWENAPSTKLACLPTPSFIPEQRQRYINVKRQIASRSSDTDLKDFIQANKYCCAPQCKNKIIEMPLMGPYRNNLIHLYKKSLERYKYHFVILSCGHYVCIKCAHSLKKASWPAVIMAKCVIPVFTCITNPKQYIFGNSKEKKAEEKNKDDNASGKIKINCPLDNCINKYKKSWYYYTDDISYVPK